MRFKAPILFSDPIDVPFDLEKQKFSLEELEWEEIEFQDFEVALYEKGVLIRRGFWLVVSKHQKEFVQESWEVKGEEVDDTVDDEGSFNRFHAQEIAYNQKIIWAEVVEIKLSINKSFALSEQLLGFIWIQEGLFIVPRYHCFLKSWVKFFEGLLLLNMLLVGILMIH